MQVVKVKAHPLQVMMLLWWAVMMQEKPCLRTVM